MNFVKFLTSLICMCSIATLHINAHTTDDLLNKLNNAVANHSFYFGHHDDTAYGHDWEYVDGASDVKSLSGEYPGILSWDLGRLELLDTRNLDGVSFNFITEEILRQHKRGGLNTISWHPNNPISGGDSWDVSTAPLKEISSNQAIQDTLVSWINRIADFIGNIRDENGERIPVIFRPWHENSGSWFWWGASHCTAEQYIDLWKLTRKCFDQKGIDNVLWAYSPDKDLTLEQYLSTYPGDEYVDILACDIYHFNGQEGLEEFERRANTELSYISEEARKRGKVAAFAETGLESVTMPEWYTKVLLPIMKRYPLAYVCIWRNANKNKLPNHFYVPFKGHSAEPDFVRFVSDPAVLLVE